MAIPIGVTQIPAYGNSLPVHAHVPSNKEASILEHERITRNLSPMPAHLSRAVYIPHHSSKTSHLPLYNVSKAYQKAIGDAPAGGSEFKTRLCLMRKPTANSLDVDVAFLVNVEHASGTATVEERRMGDSPEVNLTLLDTSEEPFSISSTHSDCEYSVETTYPLPDNHGIKETIRYPYFTLTTPHEKRVLEWQVYPATLGKLAYVLVDTSVPSDNPPIVAMYHHAGIEAEMPNKYTEGMLLMSEEVEGVDSTAIVASLFGLLWKIRGMDRSAGVKKSTGGFDKVVQWFDRGVESIRMLMMQ